MFKTFSCDSQLLHAPKHGPVLRVSASQRTDGDSERDTVILQTQAGERDTGILVAVKMGEMGCLVSPACWLPFIQSTNLDCADAVLQVEIRTLQALPLS